jgi:hypothetical protein
MRSPTAIHTAQGKYGPDIRQVRIFKLGIDLGEGEERFCTTADARWQQSSRAPCNSGPHRAALWSSFRDCCRTSVIHVPGVQISTHCVGRANRYASVKMTSEVIQRSSANWVCADYIYSAPPGTKIYSGTRNSRSFQKTGVALSAEYFSRNLATVRIGF